jgi:preprotein translocase subunit SecG
VPVSFYVNLIQIIVSVSLITVILLQAKGSGLGGIFGGDSSIYKTRRGVEKTLHQATIALSIVFFGISILSVVGLGSSRIYIIPQTDSPTEKSRV